MINGAAQPPTVGQMIVAGDGNSYTPYVYEEETDTTTESTTTSHSLTHLMLLRASPDGTSAKIELKNWTFDSTCVPWTPPSGPPNSGTQCTTSGPTPSVINLSVITNADQGAAAFTTTVLTACSSEFFSSPGIIDHESGCGDTLAHTELDYVSQDVVTSQIPYAVVLPNDDGRLQAFVPALQREDGSYIGTDTTSEIFGTSNLIAVGSAGSTLWKQAVSSTPTYITPLYATADGGMIVQSKQVQNCQSNPPRCETVGSPILDTLDQNGNLTGQTSNTSGVLSWRQTTYLSSTAQVSAIALPPSQWATSYTAFTGGNPSLTQAAIGVFEEVEGLPVFALSSVGKDCRLGSAKTSLTGDPLNKYNDAKQQLLAAGSLSSAKCSTFFNSNPIRASFFSQLGSAVSRQVPYDGVHTTISQFDAGELSTAKAARNPTAVLILKKVPVCAHFVTFKGPNGNVAPDGLVVAVSQITAPGSAPATDVYINTNSKPLKFLTQGTILHETLHNLTGLEDFLGLNERDGVQPPFDLKTLVGIETAPGVDPNSGTTTDITSQLVTNGCAAGK